MVFSSKQIGSRIIIRAKGVKKKASSSLRKSSRKCYLSHIKNLLTKLGCVFFVFFFFRSEAVSDTKLASHCTEVFSLRNPPLLHVGGAYKFGQPHFKSPLITFSFRFSRWKVIEINLKTVKVFHS